MLGSTRRRRLPELHALLVILALLGCTDTMVLVGEHGAVRLEYDCGDFQPQAHSTSEFSVVRDYAIRAVRHSVGAGDIGPVQPIMDADAGGRSGEFERLMVQYLCNGGGLSDDVPEPQGATSRFVQVPPEERFWKAGSRVPEFSLPVLNDAYFSEAPDSISLGDYSEEYVLLTFWGSWCAPCVEEQLDLVPIWEQFNDRGFAILGILYKDKPERAWAWVQHNIPNTFPTVVDDKEELAEAFAVRGVPRTYLVDPRGRIVQAWKGWLDTKADQMVRALDQVLPSATSGAPR